MLQGLEKTLLKMKTMVISPSLKLPFTMIFTGVAVTVGVSMYVLSISRLSEVDMVMLLPKTTYFYSLYHLLSFKKLLPIFADTAIAAMALMKL